MRSVAKLMSPVAQKNYGVGFKKKHEVGCRTEEIVERVLLKMGGIGEG